MTGFRNDLLLASSVSVACCAHGIVNLRLHGPDDTIFAVLVLSSQEAARLAAAAADAAAGVNPDRCEGHP